MEFSVLTTWRVDERHLIYVSDDREEKTAIIHSSFHPRHQRNRKVIIGIPSDAILIYTDGSQDESNSIESGPFIEKLSIHLSRHNPENCSVLRSELIVVDEELKSILNKTDSSNIWILTDSRSAPFNICRTGLVRMTS
ncbi:hypothetical protein TNCV_2209311 [Trichonephila clavipes]|nr:hypothetical protein TNCV_2209311 [Trichonephila clavipes]